MGFFSFLKYTFIIFSAHLATSCGAQFENHCFTVIHTCSCSPIYVGRQKVQYCKLLQALYGGCKNLNSLITSLHLQEVIKCFCTVTKIFTKYFAECSNIFREQAVGELDSRGRHVVLDTSVFSKMSVDSDTLQYGYVRTLSRFHLLVM
jgi:hypothetical protein